MPDPMDQISSNVDSTTKEIYYVDTSVILNLFTGFQHSNDSRSAKEFMKEIEEGHIIGVVSTWVILEMIHAIRKIFVSRGMLYQAIETELNKVIKPLFEINNLLFISGKPFEMSNSGLDPPLLWKVLEDSQTAIKKKYKVVDDYRESGRKTMVGIGSNDALHIGIAANIGCDFLATFDEDFWIDSHPISIYDVRNKRKR